MTWYVTYYCQDCPDDCVEQWDTTIGPFEDEWVAKIYADNDDSRPIRCVAIECDGPPVSDESWIDAPDPTILKEAQEELDELGIPVYPAYDGRY